jgi:hypothetical protein
MISSLNMSLSLTGEWADDSNAGSAGNGGDKTGCVLVLLSVLLSDPRRGFSGAVGGISVLSTAVFTGIALLGVAV